MGVGGLIVLLVGVVCGSVLCLSQCVVCRCVVWWDVLSVVGGTGGVFCVGGVLFGWDRGVLGWGGGVGGGLGVGVGCGGVGFYVCA